MNWKFWKKAGPEIGGGGAVKLPGPKDLPQQVGRFIVVSQKEDPDWVWTLKCVTKPQEGKKNIKDIRVYSPSKATEAGVSVRNFHSLDDFSNLVLYEGHFDKESTNAHLEKR
ncbi:MAG: hypothetical protein JEZ11_24830 [Desulfobacterales bacterium]|nr:hypothetical protein [Desulfobacterales bacterium]